MKKLLPILLILATLLGISIYNEINKKEEIINLSKTWQFKDKKIKKLHLEGIEQDILFNVKKTDQEQSSLSVHGEVTKSVYDILKKAKINKSSAYIPFSKDGFKLYMTSEGKKTLLFDLNVGRKGFEKIDLESSAGEVKMLVPSDFNGKYKLHLENNGKLIEKPKSNETDKSIIEITASDKVRVIKRKTQE